MIRGVVNALYRRVSLPLYVAVLLLSCVDRGRSRLSHTSHKRARRTCSRTRAPVPQHDAARVPFSPFWGTAPPPPRARVRRAAQIGPPVCVSAQARVSADTGAAPNPRQHTDTTVRSHRGDTGDTGRFSCYLGIIVYLVVLVEQRRRDSLPAAGGRHNRNVARPHAGRLRARRTPRNVNTLIAQSPSHNRHRTIAIAQLPSHNHDRTITIGLW